MKTIKIESSSEIPSNFTGIVEWADGTRYWYKEGLFHRENGPGVEYKDGTKRWYKEGIKKVIFTEKMVQHVNGGMEKNIGLKMANAIERMVQQ